MVTPQHRQAINNALYARRLRLPYHIRCLPLDKQDEWLPLPPDCRPEVTLCFEAAYARRHVETADYVTFYPQLVSAVLDHGIYHLNPRSPNSPPYLWLRFTTKTFRVNILINVGTMEYLLSTGPKIAAIGVDIPPRGIVRKHPQSKNWIAWFAEKRPDLHPHLLATRE